MILQFPWQEIFYLYTLWRKRWKSGEKINLYIIPGIVA
jgi:hypothetical protein